VPRLVTEPPTEEPSAHIAPRPTNFAERNPYSIEHILDDTPTIVVERLKDR
jgi:hypothetical protein